MTDQHVGDAEFCLQAFGKFLHHAPSHRDATAKRDGLARTYGLGAVAGLGPVAAVAIAGATVLSGRDLFSLDQQLDIPGGGEYGAGQVEDV